MKFRPFAEAREFVRKLGLKSQKEWQEYLKSGKKPEDIPNYPNDTSAYRGYWKGWGDWLGTGRIADQDKVFRPFAEAREFVHSLNLKNQQEWREYYKSPTKPQDIPTNPQIIYKKEWKGWGYWLGTGVVAAKNRKYMSFVKAREFVHKLGLKNQSEWRKYCKSGNKPDEIPTNPHTAYKKEWRGYGDWFGTGYIAPWQRKYKPFAEARKFVHSLQLKTSDEWRKYCKSGKKPEFIPANPASRYKNHWKGMGDWLGTGYVATHSRKYKPFASQTVQRSTQDLECYPI